MTTILLFAPRLRDGTDLQGVLEAEGWTVVRAASARGFAAMMKARHVDLVVLDDPPWELARFAVTAMDGAADPVPRIWLSSLPEAPGHSARLGVDALLLAPIDKPKLVDQVQALLSTRGSMASGSHPTFPLGSTLTTPVPTLAPVATPAGDTSVGLRPRKGRARTDGSWEEESTGNWP